MSHLISRHARALETFLIAIKNNRQILICDTYLPFGTLNILNLCGNEKRPFSSDEIEMILTKYVYFKEYFIKKELWIFKY